MTPKIVVRPMTCEEEVSHILMILSRLDWFRNNGYDVSVFLSRLPLDFLKYYDDHNNMTDFDVTKLNEIYKKCYDITSYAEYLSKIKKDKKYFDKRLKIFAELNKLWGFKIFSTYTLLLSHRGFGGFYDDKTGIVYVTIYTPRCSIFHEMCHIGVQFLVDKYGLSHDDKERLVDIICNTILDMKEYKMQNRGNPKLNEYITKETIIDLPKAIENFCKNK